MKAVTAMRQEAELIYGQLNASLAQIPQNLAWARVPMVGDAYLHTNGTIVGIAQHLAGCKFIAGSAAFRGLEIRFRDILERLEAIGDSWQGSLDYLSEAQEYWMASWADLSGDDELDKERMWHTAKMWPTWRILATSTQNDAYHTGQIELLSSTLTPTNERPDMGFEEERKILVELPNW